MSKNQFWWIIAAIFNASWCVKNTSDLSIAMLALWAGLTLFKATIEYFHDK